MLRGSQKQMIVVRTHGNRVFEEAYFVIRRDAMQGRTDETDMLHEANRIIESSLPPAARSVPCRPQAEREPRFNLIAGLVWFFMGFASGAGLIGLLWLILR